MQLILIGPRGSDKPVAMSGEGRRIGEPYTPSEVPLSRFEAFSWDAAVNYFHEVQAHGIKAAMGGRHSGPTGPWRCRGGPDYLGRQAVRLEVSQRIVEQAKGNKELHQVSTLVGQLQSRYYAAPKRGDDREFSPVELKTVAGILDQCEPEIAKLYALAASAESMADDARRAFGLNPPVRQFRVVADSDAPVFVVDAKLDMTVAEPTSEPSVPTIPDSTPEPTTPVSPNPTPEPRPKLPPQHDPKSRPHNHNSR